MSKLWIAIIVILVVVGGVWWMKNGGSVSFPSLYTSSPTASASKAPVAGGTQKTATPAPTQALSYTQLVQQFGSNRIQFDSTCQATPKSVVFKNGTQILLDNRSSQARTIGIDGKTYSLGSYGYQVVTLSSTNLPKMMNVSCNDQINTATINLQANISGQ